MRGQGNQCKIGKTRYENKGIKAKLKRPDKRTRESGQNWKDRTGEQGNQYKVIKTR